MFLSKNAGAFVPLNSKGIPLSQSTVEPNESVCIVLVALCDIALSLARADAVWTLWMLHHAVSVSMTIGDCTILRPTWFQYDTEGLVLHTRASISLESATLVFILYVGLVGYRTKKLRQAFNIFDATVDKIIT